MTQFTPNVPIADQEVSPVLSLMEASPHLVAQLLDGSGLRINVSIHPQPTQSGNAK
jgi:hypothetical protein